MQVQFASASRGLGQHACTLHTSTNCMRRQLSGATNRVTSTERSVEGVTAVCCKRAAVPETRSIDSLARANSSDFASAFGMLLHACLYGPHPQFKGAAPGRSGPAKGADRASLLTSTCLLGCTEPCLPAAPGTCLIPGTDLVLQKSVERRLRHESAAASLGIGACMKPPMARGRQHLRTPAPQIR